MKKLISILTLALIVSPILAMESQEPSQVAAASQSAPVAQDTINAEGSAAAAVSGADKQGDGAGVAVASGSSAKVQKIEAESQPKVEVKKGLFTSAKGKIVDAASFVTTKAGDAAGAVNTKFWGTYNSEKGGYKLVGVALGAFVTTYGMYQTYVHGLVSRGLTRVKSGVKSLKAKWHNRGKNKAVAPKEATPAA